MVAAERFFLVFPMLEDNRDVRCIGSPIKSASRQDAYRCECGGRMKIVAAVTDPASVRRYLKGVGLPADPPLIAPARASPQIELDFDQRQQRSFWNAPSRVGAELRAGSDSRDSSGQVLTFSATVVANMMPWRHLCGTDGCHSGRFDGALGVERGVETEAKGAGRPPVAPTNIAFIWPTLQVRNSSVWVGSCSREAVPVNLFC
jgi:hypothetical protein